MSKNLFTKRAYSEAVKQAYYGDGCWMHSPAIWWTGEKLIVRSAMTDCGTLIHTANFAADTGKPTAPDWHDALKIAAGN